MADSDGEEAFHSAGEEDIADLPLQKPNSKTAEFKQTTSSSKSVNSKEDTQSSNQTARKSKGKKKKGKNALKTTEEKHEGQSEKNQERKTDVGKEKTNQCSESEKQEREFRSANTEGDSKCTESRPQQENRTLESIQAKTTSFIDEHKSQKVEDRYCKEAAEATIQSDCDILHGEPKQTEEIPEEVLEPGSRVIQDGQDGSIKLDGHNMSDENEASSSKIKSGQDSQTEEGSGWNASVSGALGTLNGEKTEQKESSGGGWGWGGWGASFVSSVSAMGHGLSSVIENVETSLGLPKPEELTEQEKREQQFIVTEDEQETKEEIKKEDVDEKENGGDAGDEGRDEKVEQGEEAKEDDRDETAPIDKSESASMMKGFLSYGASTITTIVGKTVTGGLDALETIGRKTMDVLQEGDHGHIMGRDHGNKGNLSEVLREAKEEAETAASLEEEEKERQRAHFGILFDQYQGLAHLEALEMISNQSESKIQGSLNVLCGDDLQSLKTELIEIRDAFQLEELESEEQPDGSEQDFVNSITEHLFGVSVASTPDKLQRVQRSVHEWLAECKTQQEAGQKQDIKEVHIKAIESLAEFSSRVIEQFHKACELMLLPQDKEHSKSPVERATCLSKLTSVLAAEVGNRASKFADCLNREAEHQEDGETNEDVNPLITNIYLEASNSTSYIQDAFQLVLPVLQMVAVERKKEIPS